LNERLHINLLHLLSSRLVCQNLSLYERFDVLDLVASVETETLKSRSCARRWIMGLDRQHNGLWKPSMPSLLLCTYPSDLSDREWELLAPLIPPAKPGGRPRKWSMRNAAQIVIYTAELRYCGRSVFVLCSYVLVTFGSLTRLSLRLRIGVHGVHGVHELQVAGEELGAGAPTSRKSATGEVHRMHLPRTFGELRNCFVWPTNGEIHSVFEMTLQPCHLSQSCKHTEPYKPSASVNINTSRPKKPNTAEMSSAY
jgi:hypothetical protein